MPSMNKAFATALAGVFAASNLHAAPVQAITRDEILSLSYSQVKGTGLANRCPEVIGEQSITLQSGKKYKVVDLCLEPKSWQVSNCFASPATIIICLINVSYVFFM